MSATREPWAPSPLIGRRQEIPALDALIEQHRVVTLWGPAGMGKSRLALHLVEERRRRGERALFVELAGVRDSEELASVLIHALDPDAARRRRAGRAGQVLRTALKSHAPTLLVWDNVEQIVDEAAALLLELVREPSAARFLITSRERLRVAPERCFELSPLSLPQEGEDPLTSDAVALLVERARDGGHAIDFGPADHPHLARIVRELEGVPLAIELAAARLGVLGLAGLLARLPRPLDVLVRGRRDMPARQASLRGAVAWSWELLPALERRVLARCAVFRGGFDVEAARAVVNLPDDQVVLGLSELADKSLVRLCAEPGRFAFFESVRAFADETLGAEERAEVTRRHRAHFAERSEGARRADADAENFAAAARAALDADDVDAALTLALALDAILVRRGPLGLHRGLLDRVLAAAAGRADARVAALHLARGNAWAMAGRVQEAERDFDAALGLAADEGDATMARVQLERGLFLHRERRLAEAAQAYAAAAERYERVRDDVGQGRALGNLGAVAHDGGELDEAEARYAQAITRLRRAGATRIAATLECNCALLEQERGALDEAALRFDRAVAELELEGDRRLLAIALGNRAALALERGHAEEARAGAERALALLAELGDARSLAIARVRLAATLAELDLQEPAAALFATARAALAGVDDPLAHAVLEVFEAFLDLGLGRRALADGHKGRGAAHFARVRDRIAAALAGGEDAPAAKADDVRVAVRLLERGLVRAIVREGEASPVLIVERSGRWLRIGAGEVEWIERRRAPRLILLALARLREADPNAGLSLEALFEAGWPGERARFDAMENRVAVALAFLRRGALRPHLYKTERGYALPPDLPLLWADEDPA